MRDGVWVLLVEQDVLAAPTPGDRGSHPLRADARLGVSGPLPSFSSTEISVAALSPVLCAGRARVEIHADHFIPDAPPGGGPGATAERHRPWVLGSLFRDVPAEDVR